MFIASILRKSITDIFNLDEKTLEGLGARDTVREICQQGRCYLKTAALILEQREALSRFLEERGLGVVSGSSSGAHDGGANGDYSQKPRVILTGAGSSWFVGTASYRMLQRAWGTAVEAVASTELTTHPERFTGMNLLVIHCARSGDSPESLRALEQVQRVAPKASHIVLTCNPEGALAKLSESSASVYTLVLPPETNDNSLVMTSAFSSMLLAVLLLTKLGEPERIRLMAQYCSQGMESLFAKPSEMFFEICSRGFSRVCALGAGSLSGLLEEGKLKIQEMNAARIGVFSSNFLELRHGPKVFVDADTLVVAHLSPDTRVQPYETDLLKELRAGGQGKAVLTVCLEEQAGQVQALSDYVIALPSFDFQDESEREFYRLLVDIGVEQQLAFFSCLFRGLSPDNPSPDGTINRVVQGVKIYPM